MTLSTHVRVSNWLEFWKPSKTVPPRDPDDDDDSEDEEDNEQDEEREPAVIREPDE
jgi:hypothetical protein